MVGPSAPPFVFVSYAHADRSVVARLIAGLQARDIAIWIDERGLKPGTHDWEQALRDAIRAAHAIVLVASPASRESPYVVDELAIAKMYQRTVYPVWVAGEQWMECIRIGWGLTQYVDARDNKFEAALNELVATLRDTLSPSQTAASAVTVKPEPSFTPRNPYKGLRAFTAEDAGDFYGREQLIEQLLACLPVDLDSVPRFLAVVGPSGSGKSSVVRAGLLPRLQQGGLSGSDTWHYLEPIVPGTHPLEGLTLSLASALPGSSLTAIHADLNDSPRGLHLLACRLVAPSRKRVVLVIDQFEELFSPTTSEDERRQALELLVTAVTEVGGPLLVILTLRADFYDRPMSYPSLFPLIDAHSKLIPPMSLTELREAIERPAALPDVRLTFEGDLVGDLLFEVRGQAGALPLLQFTLDQLFERREDRCLTLAAYHELGGVRGALAKHAEATYNGLLLDEHRRLARALFLRLIDPGATEQDTVRRRAALTELVLPDPHQTTIMGVVADAFVDARLLVTTESAGTTTIEVSHEALIREWERLGDWLREAREDVRLQQAISGDAMEWLRHGKPIDNLYRGRLLDEAKAWADRNAPSAIEMTFLEAASAEREQQDAAERARQLRELHIQRSAAIRLRYLVGVLAAFLLVAALLTALAVSKSLQAGVAQRRAVASAQTAVAERNIALSDQLAAQATTYLDSNIKLALLLSVEATRAANTAQARDSLLAALEASAQPSLIGSLPGQGSGTYSSMAFSFDGKTIAEGSDDQTIHLWDVSSLHALGHPLVGHNNLVLSVALNRDGTILASGGRDGTIRLWDVSSHRSLGRVLVGLADWVLSVAFSPNGKILAAGSRDGMVRLWDVPGLHSWGRPLAGFNGGVLSVAFSPDSRTLAAGSGDGTVRLWNMPSLHSLGALPSALAGWVLSVAFSPDSKTLASVGCSDRVGTVCRQGVIQLWDAVHRRPRGAAMTVSTDALQSVAFSPDGQTLATGGRDSTLRLWDVPSLRSLGAPIVGHLGWVTSVAFDRSGRTLAADSRDGTVRLWDMTRRQGLGIPLIGHNDQVRGVAFSPSGILAAGGCGAIVGDKCNRGMIQLWDVAHQRVIRTLFTSPVTGDVGAVTSLAFSPDGQIMASGSVENSIQLWDTASWRSLARFPVGRTGRVLNVAFSPNGKILAAGGCRDFVMNAKSPNGGVCRQGVVQLWDVLSNRSNGMPIVRRRGAPLVEPAAWVTGVAFSSDSQTLATGGRSDGAIRLWDVASRRRQNSLLVAHKGIVYTVAYSPKGQMLASGSQDGTVLLWDIASRHNVVLGEHNKEVASVAFSPDGKTLASGSWDNTVRLWDVASRQPFSSALTGHEGKVASVAFSPDGKTLASGSLDKTVRLWSVNLESWRRRACSIAAGDLTAPEYQQFLKTCP